MRALLSSLRPLLPSLLAAAMVLGTGGIARAAIPTGNLVVNGDAESGAGAVDAETTAPVPIPGWQTTPNFTEHVYDPAGSSDFPDVNASKAIGGAKQFFAGGPENSANDSETASQTIDVSAAAAEIDRGVVTAELSADLGGFADQGDAATVDASFDGASGQLGQITIGPVTPAARHDQTSLVPVDASAAVPKGTRTIRVVIVMTKTDGAYNDAYADNISLTIIPPPVLGKAVNVDPVSGTVLVKLPGSASAAAVSKGKGFVPLTAARQLPVGTQVDARRGTLSLVAATGKGGKTQSGVFGGGLFGLSQDTAGVTKGVTTLSLLYGAFTGAPSFSRCGGRAHGAPDAPRPRQPRPLPHADTLERGHQPRHRVGHDRPLRRDADGRPSRHGPGARFRARQDRDRACRPQVPGQALLVGVPNRSRSKK